MTDGRLVAFMGPVGVVSPDGPSTQNAEQLLGRSFRLETEPTDMRCEATGLWEPIAGIRWGVTDGKLDTYNLLPDGLDEKEVLAKLLDGRPSAFYRADGPCKIFWSAAPGLKPPVVRELARHGNVPVIASQNDGIYAGCGFIGIHAHSDGEKHLRLPRPCALREIISGRVWPAGTTEITLPMRRGDTRIFLVPEESASRK